MECNGWGATNTFVLFVWFVFPFFRQPPKQAPSR